MEFKLHIVLGNAAMQNGYDVAMALRTIAMQVEHIEAEGLPRREDVIRDTNGHSVGKWKVVGK